MCFKIGKWFLWLEHLAEALAALQVFQAISVKRDMAASPLLNRNKLPPAGPGLWLVNLRCAVKLEKLTSF